MMIHTREVVTALSWLSFGMQCMVYAPTPGAPLVYAPEPAAPWCSLGCAWRFVSLVPGAPAGWRA